ncbi:terminase large subunit domain-containing protein [Roseibium aggregatum]|uniref:Terminase-like family protein n=1 Tax=Roseibium aggregatum TaxID=187304 RepID=A0A0M6Y8Y6_9HYPH|nr:terminase family protein [Roseibium aggregatum]CTQ45737.1 Terminase-like family protein [Roseibium aggregatum]
MQLQLFPKQTLAFTSLATEILYGGAAGGGKSHLMRVAAVAWCIDVPGIQVYIFRRQYGDLFANHMEGPSGFLSLLSEWVEAGYVKINLSDNKIRFWNGSVIHLCHCQHEKDRFKYQGAEIHVLMIDELTHFTDKIYRFLRNRVRLSGLDIPAKYKGLFPRILCGSNPGGVGHTWVKSTFIDPKPELEIYRASDDEGGMLRQYIPAKMSDNPKLAEDDPDYEKRLKGLGDEALVRAMKDGDWNIALGAFFADVWKPGRIILPHFKIPNTWRVDRSFDWGSAKPSATIWWAETDGTEVEIPGRGPFAFPRGSLIAISEDYTWNGKPDEGLRLHSTELARRIKEIEGKLGLSQMIHPGPADNAIYDVQDGKSIASEMEKIGVRWIRSDKSPGSRVNGWDHMRKMLKNAAPTDEEGNALPVEEPGLWVMDNCRHIIRTLPALPRDENKPDDIDTKAEDHIADAARYRVAAPKRSVTSSKLGGT